MSSNNTSETEEAFIYVFGEWSCLICKNKWTHRKTQIHLSKYKEGINANDLEDNERVGQQCRKCCSENSKLVNYSLLPPKSVHLISPKYEISEDEETSEDEEMSEYEVMSEDEVTSVDEETSEDEELFVHKHLIWKYKNKVWYRVFGTWICDHDGCDNKWTSAHTYILLSKYEAKVAAADLVRDHHYWRQDCITTNDRGKLIKYRQLQKSAVAGTAGHEKNHCLKCMAGYLCVFK